MSEPSQNPSPLRHMLWLAWILSALYLAAGAIAAAVHRLTHGQYGTQVYGALERFGEAFLRMLHLWEPLMVQYAMGKLETWQLRLILMSLSVALIFLYALTLGLLLSGLRRLWERDARR